ncbi:MAG: alcohol dehydrogenase catalytic domain-containing protein [Candidatus Caldarchaeum sp.]|nr:alcohol dehydrogenase catalytic domain-containing protein [Candidatus Caldarchaeum sp.]
MKAVFVKQGGGVEVRDVDVPKIGDGEILVKMKACGIDGTDLEKAFGRPLTPPMLGHEVVGIVEESRTSEFEEGDRVFVHHHVFCGRCYYCLNDSLTMCPLFLKTTIDPCGFAEYFRVPRTNVERGAVLKLPPNLDWVEASFIEPVACVLRALKRTRFTAGRSVSMVGAGPTGSLFIQLLKLMGASFVAVAEISPFRLQKAKELGADATANPLSEDFVDVCRCGTDGRGVDIGVLATPAVRPLQLVIDSVRRGGTICIFGAPEKGEKAELDFSRLFIEEKSIITSYSTTEIETNAVLDLVKSGRTTFRKSVSHVYPLEDASLAFETARDASRSLKVVLTS